VTPNPRNIPDIPVVKIFTFPSGTQARLAGGLSLNKNEHFSKVSVSEVNLKIAQFRQK
jgi:hypothetical protein